MPFVEPHTYILVEQALKPIGVDLAQREKLMATLGSVPPPQGRVVNYIWRCQFNEEHAAIREWEERLLEGRKKGVGALLQVRDAKNFHGTSGDYPILMWQPQGARSLRHGMNFWIVTAEKAHDDKLVASVALPIPRHMEQPAHV